MAPSWKLVGRFGEVELPGPLHTSETCPCSYCWCGKCGVRRLPKSVFRGLFSAEARDALLETLGGNLTGGESGQDCDSPTSTETGNPTQHDMELQESVSVLAQGKGNGGGFLQENLEEQVMDLKNDNAGLHGSPSSVASTVVLIRSPMSKSAIAAVNTLQNSAQVEDSGQASGVDSEGKSTDSGHCEEHAVSTEESFIDEDASESRSSTSQTNSQESSSEVETSSSRCHTASDSNSQPSMTPGNESYSTSTSDSNSNSSDNESWQLIQQNNSVDSPHEFNLRRQVVDMQSTFRVTIRNNFAGDQTPAELDDASALGNPAGAAGSPKAETTSKRVNYPRSSLRRSNRLSRWSAVIQIRRSSTSSIGNATRQMNQSVVSLAPAPIFESSFGGRKADMQPNSINEQLVREYAKFKCEHCDQAFFSMGHLINHLPSHVNFLFPHRNRRSVSRQRETVDSTPEFDRQASSNDDRRQENSNRSPTPSGANSSRSSHQQDSSTSEVDVENHVSGASQGSDLYRDTSEHSGISDVDVSTRIYESQERDVDVAWRTSVQLMEPKGDEFQKASTPRPAAHTEVAADTRNAKEVHLDDVSEEDRHSISEELPEPNQPNQSAEQERLQIKELANQQNNPQNSPLDEGKIDSGGNGLYGLSEVPAQPVVDDRNGEQGDASAESCVNCAGPMSRMRVQNSGEDLISPEKEVQDDLGIMYCQSCATHQVQFELPDKGQKTSSDELVKASPLKVRRSKRKRVPVIEVCDSDGNQDNSDNDSNSASAGSNEVTTNAGANGGSIEAPSSTQLSPVDEVDETHLSSGSKNPKRKQLCYECGNRLKTRAALTQHLKEHDSIQPFKCALCPVRFETEKKKFIHQKAHSDANGRYKCNECEYAFQHVNDLVRHKRVHSGERPYKCDQCKESYTQSCNLTVHKRVHSGERPYKCDQCMESFTQSSNLTVHKRVHSGERPFRCDQCTESFTHSGDLTRHKRVHSGERPFKCDQCTESFKDSSHLARHKRIHSGEKPSTCDQCGKGFSRKEHLRQHQRTVRCEIQSTS